MPKAYWISTYRAVKNPDKLAAYAKLAGPALTDEQNRLGAVDIAAVGQVTHLRRSHIRGLGVVKFLESLQPRKMSIPQSALDGVPFALFHFRQQQRFQVAHVTLLLANCLVGQSPKLRRHHRHAQHFTVGFDGGFL